MASSVSVNKIIEKNEYKEGTSFKKIYNRKVRMKTQLQ